MAAREESPRQVSLRQPVVLYAMLFSVAIAAAVLLLASFSLITASRRAYRRAAQQELQALARTHSPQSLRHALTAPQRSQDMELRIVSAAEAPPEVLAEAREAARDAPLDRVAVTLQGSAEAYLLVRLDPSIPLAIAFVEIARMVPLVLIGALLFAGGLSFLLSRLLLPPLDALAAIANETRTEDLGPVPEGAPDEIALVAQRFRHTVRQLNEERERVEAQRDELSRMQRGLIRASKLASVGRLAAGVAHEVGNPLAAVQGYLSLLQSGLTPEEEAEVTARSLKELRRIHETIKKLLTYARQEVSDGPAVRFSLKQRVQAALSLSRGLPQLRGVEVQEQLPEAEFFALGHPARFEQVLLNLLMNAGQALAELPVGAPRLLSIRLREEDAALELSVEDSGPGVPEEQAEQIFDPFFTTKAPGEGTGLGLAVSRALMEAMGGGLELDASSVAGARFVIRLPRAP